MVERTGTAAISRALRRTRDQRETQPQLPRPKPSSCYLLYCSASSLGASPSEIREAPPQTASHLPAPLPTSLAEKREREGESVALLPKEPRGFHRPFPLQAKVRSAIVMEHGYAEGGLFSLQAAIKVAITRTRYNIVDKLHCFLVSDIFLYIQWSYALWQAIRGHSLVRLVLAVLYTPFLSRKRNFPVLVTQKYRDYDCEVSEINTNPFDDLVHVIERKYSWFKVKTHHACYWVHLNCLCELTVLDSKLRDKGLTLWNVTFLVDKAQVNPQLSVAKVISREEAFDKLFSKSYHLAEVSDKCFYRRHLNEEPNAELAAFMATIPLVLQAKSMAFESALASFFLIVFDFVRTPLYNLYIRITDLCIREIKLRVMRKNEWMYTLLGTFSERWEYCDHEKKHAYVAAPGTVMRTVGLMKFNEPGDYEIIGFGIHEHDPQYGVEAFTINMGTMHSTNLQYGQAYINMKCHVPSFVSNIVKS